MKAKLVREGNVAQLQKDAAKAVHKSFSFSYGALIARLTGTLN